MVVSATEIRTVAELLQVSPEGLQKAITFKVTVSAGGTAWEGVSGPWGPPGLVLLQPHHAISQPGNAAGEDFYPSDCGKRRGCQVEGRGAALQEGVGGSHLQGWHGK